MKLSKIKRLVISHWLLAIFILVIGVFFREFLLADKLPIPADTIVGMYHPWRDKIWDNFTAGVPFKNFLITDPVRQQYPWRQLAIDLFKKGQLPLWNPYVFAGTPLLANFQGAAFYPFNFLYLFLPFNLAWGILIFLQPLLAGIFLYAYLDHLKLEKPACLIGALSFSFSGFFIAWLEWGTVLQVGLWLPLILLATDKILIDKKRVKWGAVLLFSLCAQFFAGHLQTSFYLVLFSLLYLFWRLSQVKKNRPKRLTLFIVLYLMFVLLTAVQWFPTLQFIKLSARAIDQAQFNQPGWFLPWQNLIQFLVPDFFGNPTTLNYWGVFNYAEFIGYLGVIPLIFSLLAIFWRRDQKTSFFTIVFLVALSFALPTPWAKWPYQLGLPLVATSQPTRLIFIVDFCLVVLAAFGLDAFLRKKMSWRKMASILLSFSLFYGLLWLFVLGVKKIWPEDVVRENLAVSQRNLILPTAILVMFSGLIFTFYLIQIIFKKRKQFIPHTSYLIPSAILLLIIFDLLRFGWKFTPFTKKDWLFPTTETTKFLKKDKTPFRFMTTDRRLFAPNFSLAYQLQTVEGYDPIYLRRYAEMIAASERGKPDINPPFGYNRIITPHDYQSRIIDLLNVKYVLSLKDEDSPKLVKVFQEGQTRVYENKDVLPRAFLVYDYQIAKNKQEAISFLMDESIDLAKIAILEEKPTGFEPTESEGKVEMMTYQENKVNLRVKTDLPGILVLTDAYYPGWQAKVDGQETRIYLADYHFRGIIVPEGTHEVIFEYGWY